jgi:acetyl esterase/lipase
VFIAGGGWHVVNRSGLAKPMRWAAERGYVAITIDHRSTIEGVVPKYPFPAQVHDAKCAVRWLRSEADRYDIDPNRVGAVGVDAGGYLALMLALTDPADELEGSCGDTNVSSGVQVAADLIGPAELAAHYETTNEIGRYSVRRLLAAEPGDAAEQYRLASPLTYVDGGDPPVLSMFYDLASEAERDDTIYIAPEQGRLLDDAMRQAGASHTLDIREGKKVDYFAEPRLEVYEAVFAFCDSHLK